MEGHFYLYGPSRWLVKFCDLCKKESMEAGSPSRGRSDNILAFRKGADVRESFHISLTDTILHADMIRSLAMAFSTYIRGTVHNISFRTGHEKSMGTTLWKVS